MKAEWTNNDSLTTSQTTKAILVIDVPDDYMGSVIDVELYSKGKTVHEKYVNKLKPMPQPIWHEEGKENECEEWYRNGWNACIEELEKC